MVPFKREINSLHIYIGMAMVCKNVTCILAFFQNITFIMYAQI